MMKARRVLWLLGLMAVALVVNAAPRSRMLMKQEAEKAIFTICKPLPSSADALKLLDKKQGMTIWGYQGGGFAVIADDDRHPAVLGYSAKPYRKDTSNPGFKWWLQAMETVLARESGIDAGGKVAKSSEYPIMVAPLLTTAWGQDQPYNNFCPSHCPTGCVSTATCQVLKFFSWPKRGKGTAFTYLPFGDHVDGIRLEEVLDDVEYRYDLMTDSYGLFSTDAQRSAVAQLMYHVGLSIKSIYERNGTGAYNETLCHGLRTHLGYPYAVTIDRVDYTQEEWMDIIYTHLSAGIPLIYGGTDDDYAGHEFVLDGYDAKGAVHINWGWYGDMDGYFNLEGLTVSHYYDFSLYQDMVLGCCPERTVANVVSVEMRAPGTLGEMLDEAGRDTIVCLSVKGGINGSDLKVLRAMAGRDERGHGTMGRLSVLDLSEAVIVEGGDAYLTDDGVAFFTHDDEMPWKAFANCNLLIDVRLPRRLQTYSGAVFAGCNNLESVELVPMEGADFLMDHGYVLTTDRLHLIEYLPDGGGEIECYVPDGVTSIGDYAFAGRYLYEWMWIPASVKRIGKYAFNRCFNLSRTYVASPLPPEIDPTAIDMLDLSLRRLYVPKGSAVRYKLAEGWGNYSSRIKEFNFTEGIVKTPANKRLSRTGSYDVGGRLWGNADRPHGIQVIDGVKILVK